MTIHHMSDTPPHILYCWAEPTELLGHHCRTYWSILHPDLLAAISCNILTKYSILTHLGGSLTNHSFWPTIGPSFVCYIQSTATKSTFCCKSNLLNHTCTVIIDECTTWNTSCISIEDNCCTGDVQWSNGLHKCCNVSWCQGQKNHYLAFNPVCSSCDVILTPNLSQMNETTQFYWLILTAPLYRNTEWPKCKGFIYTNCMKAVHLSLLLSEGEMWIAMGVLEESYIEYLVLKSVRELIVLVIFNVSKCWQS